MRLATAGAWAAVAVGLFAQAAPIIWPNDLTVGYFIMGGGGVVALIAGAFLISRPKVPMTERVPPTLPRMQIGPEVSDEEINMQQAFHLICDRIGVTKRGGGNDEVDARLNIFRDLRQKARDGKIIVRGRLQPLGFLAGAYKPREPIPSEHWGKMDFDPVRYIFAETTEFVTETQTEADHEHDRGNPDPYCDLVVSREAVEREWPRKEKGGTVMIPAVQLLKEAGRCGWNVSAKGIDVIRLQVGLREAALHGDVKIYGRQNLYTQSLTRHEPRSLIPSSFWSSGWLQIIAALPDGGSENFNTQAYVPVEKATYVDIHFGPEALGWLTNGAEQYRNLPVKA